MLRGGKAGAGVAQTTGWPGTVSVLGKWFGTGKRGLIFGVWNSHTSIGNILGTLLASDYVEGDWSLSFIYPALAMGCVATLVFLFLPPEPKHVGIVLQPTDNCPSRQSRSDDEEEPQVIVGDQAASLRPNRHSANNPPYQASEDATEETAPAPSSLSLRTLAPSRLLARWPSPAWWNLLCLCFSLNCTSAILAGLLADRSASPATVCGAFYLLGAPALLIYQWWGATSYWLNVVLLVIAGALVNGPYALITTAVSTELVNAIRLWNSLPAEIRDGQTVSTFKKRLQEHYLST
ncbi:hypothetical protein evm_003159 [Chilo suppressalis]|nr:hypothetical protein evm_003159 [Chilo suppressalis]